MRENKRESKYFESFSANPDPAHLGGGGKPLKYESSKDMVK